jgi:hypothetical protein
MSVDHMPGHRTYATSIVLTALKVNVRLPYQAK